MTGTSVPVGGNPGPALYDRENGYVYVIHPTTDNLTVINGTTTIGSVDVGQYPEFGAVNDRSGYVYVPNYFDGTVSVVNGTKVVGSIYDDPEVGPDLTYPAEAAYDEADGHIYVTNSVASNVSVINGTKLFGSVNVGDGPDDVLYDPVNQYVYVTNYESDSVSVINGTKVLATVPVGSYPEDATCDGENGYVYVSNTNSANVSVLNGTHLAGTVNVGHDPSWAAFDADNGFVYVPNYDSDNVSIINGTHLLRSVSVGTLPDAAVYDSGNGFVYVPNYGTSNVVYDNVSILDGTSILGSVKVGYQPDDPTYDSLNGYVYVPNYDSANVSVVYSNYSVTFTESGLPPATEWWINLTGAPSLSTDAADLSVFEYEGAYPYSVSTSDKTYSAPGGTLVVNGTTSLTIQFSRVTYAVAFTGTGLPVVTNWSVTIRGSSGTARYSSSTPTIRFLEPNATYTFTLGMVPGFTTTSFRGLFVVLGGPANLSIAWTQVNYTVAFEESGLPMGTVWWVNVTGGNSTSSTNAGLSLSEPNGTWAYSVASDDLTYSSPGGSFTVSGTAARQAIVFLRVTYSVNFTAIGLPAGTNWSVALGGTTNSSAAATLAFMVPNGTYSYALGTVSGWTTSIFSGSVAVDGMAISQSVTWTPVTYSVAFTEKGLPSGASWTVTLDGIRQSSSAATLAFSLGNGTYRFSAGTVPGYTESPSSGSITIQGANVTKTMAFSVVPSNPSASSATILGLPAIEGYALLGGLAVAVAAIALGAVRWNRKRRRPPGPRSSP
jgi:YVTN family beta-propeller protein